MRAALFAFSRGGCATARRILAALPEEAWKCYTMPRFEEPGFLPLDKAVYGASFSASSTASAFATPIWPESRGITNRPASSMQTTAGSVFLLLT